MEFRDKVVVGVIGILALLLIGYMVVLEPVSYAKKRPQVEGLCVDRLAAQSVPDQKKLFFSSPFEWAISPNFPQQEEVDLPSSVIKTDLMTPLLWKGSLGAVLVVALCIFLCSCDHNTFRKRLALVGADLKTCHGCYGKEERYDNNHERFFVLAPNDGDVAYVKQALDVGTNGNGQAGGNLKKAYQHVQNHRWDALQKLLEKGWNYGLLYLVPVSDPNSGKGNCLAKMIALQYSFRLSGGNNPMNKEQAISFLALMKKAGSYVPEEFGSLEKKGER